MSGWTKLRATARFLFLLLVFATEPAVAATCPSPPTRAEATQSTSPPLPFTLKPYSITDTVARYYDAPLGLGYLEVVEEKNEHYYDWMFELTFPVWAAPDPLRPLGWLVHGLVYTDTGVTALTGVGMVETEYEHTSFIVWDTHAEWMKVKLTDDLSVWTHRCHLHTPDLSLAFVPWQLFFRRHADWLHFRKPVPHILRTSPNLESARVTTIGLDHKLVLLDIRGDWMEVEVRQPDPTCRDPAPSDAQSMQYRGWVKWRDQRGPWVYIYTRGC